jgi:hypothetical protein
MGSRRIANLQPQSSLLSAGLETDMPLSDMFFYTAKTALSVFQPRSLADEQEERKTKEREHSCLPSANWGHVLEWRPCLPSSALNALLI